MVVHALPAHLSLSVCLSGGGASICNLVHLPQPDSRPMLSLVASRSWAWCFIHLSVLVRPDPTPLGWLVRSSRQFMPTPKFPSTQPLVVLGVTVMDPILVQSVSQVSRSLSRPSHPIPSSPFFVVVWLPSSSSSCWCPRLHPHPSIHPPIPPLAGPSFRAAGRPHSHALSLVPVVILPHPPPCLMGSWVSLPPVPLSLSHSLPSSCLSILARPPALVLFALVVWV